MAGTVNDCYKIHLKNGDDHAAYVHVMAASFGRKLNGDDLVKMPCVVYVADKRVVEKYQEYKVD